MIHPTVHLNGTSATSLLEQYTAARDALAVAHQAINQAAPHRRDYYPQGPAALFKATAEHVDRMRCLESLKKEYDELIEEVSWRKRQEDWL